MIKSTNIPNIANNRTLIGTNGRTLIGEGGKIPLTFYTEEKKNDIEIISTVFFGDSQNVSNSVQTPYNIFQLPLQIFNSFLGMSNNSFSNINLSTTQKLKMDNNGNKYSYQIVKDLANRMLIICKIFYRFDTNVNAYYPQNSKPLVIFRVNPLTGGQLYNILQYPQNSLKSFDINNVNVIAEIHPETLEKSSYRFLTDIDELEKYEIISQVSKTTLDEQEIYNSELKFILQN